ncbi:539_t:CDS:2, partial [Diversispora eburnea]
MSRVNEYVFEYGIPKVFHEGVLRRVTRKNENANQNFCRSLEIPESKKHLG